MPQLFFFKEFGNLYVMKNPDADFLLGADSSNVEEKPGRTEMEAV